MRTPTPAGYADREATQAPPWHGLVVTDVFLNALTTGLFLTAAVGELARPDLFVPIAAWAYPLALALLLADLTCLVLDLGSPTRFHHMLRVFKPLSPMSLGTWCLTAYSLPLTALLAIDVFTWFGWLPDGSAAVGALRKALLVVGLPFAFGSMAYKGVLFSTSSQPGWRDARWFGAYHAASALALGCAALLALAVVADDGRAADVLRPALAALVVVQCVPLALLAVELWPALVRRYRPADLRLTATVAVAGTLVPLAVLLLGNGRALATAAVALVLAAGWAVRHAVVILPHHGPGAARGGEPCCCLPAAGSSAVTARAFRKPGRPGPGSKEASHVT